MHNIANISTHIAIFYFEVCAEKNALVSLHDSLVHIPLEKMLKLVFGRPVWRGD
jgi:hypothetical protein